jgi:hypothetical protein
LRRHLLLLRWFKHVHEGIDCSVSDVPPVAQVAAHVQPIDGVAPLVLKQGSVLERR